VKQEVLRGAHEGAAVVLEHPTGDDAVDMGVVVAGLALPVGRTAMMPSVPSQRFWAKVWRVSAATVNSRP
jgi:hypothetical protein